MCIFIYAKLYIYIFLFTYNIYIYDLIHYHSTSWHLIRFDFTKARTPPKPPASQRGHEGYGEAGGELREQLCDDIEDQRYYCFILVFSLDSKIQLPQILRYNYIQHKSSQWVFFVFSYSDIVTLTDLFGRQNELGLAQVLTPAPLSPKAGLDTVIPYRG